MNTYPSKPLHAGQTPPAIDWKVVVRFIIIGLVLPLIPFMAAGTFDWWQGWVFYAVAIISGAGSRIILFRKNPTLIAERARFTSAANIKGWDKWLVTIIAIIGPLVAYIVAGLDKRYGWSPEVGSVGVLIGILLLVFGTALSTWAMVVNAYFSSVVRIQTDRNHTVISSGPYRIVRHPGYSGGAMAWVGIPLIFGTLWAFIPAGIVIILYIVRTALEDRTLQRELAGYAAYAQQTRYRLLPGVW
ncbi:MAG: isoprenylcysteine carboxylmethyltransferase family protein [Anaerolineae bacterium]|nr:isoprenylcysteine carboxylmethyltransferase family protein [Anaerolineae bacterium]